jgi:hypothetical protein
MKMSEEFTTHEEVRLARQGYEAMSRGDLDAVMSLFHSTASPSDRSASSLVLYSCMLSNLPSR